MKLRLWIFVVALLGTRSLSGGMVSYTHSESTLPPGSAGTFTVPQYNDPGGMPLTKVTLTVSGFSSGGSNTFDNEAPSSGTATVKIGSNIDVRGPMPGVGSQLIVDSDPQNSNSGTVAADNDGAPDFAGTDSISVSGTGASDLDSAMKTLAADLVPYQGAGLATFSFATLSNTAGSSTTTGGGSNMVVPGPIRADFTATITYEFVPEPASGTLLLAGAIAWLVALGKRRARRLARQP